MKRGHLRLAPWLAPPSSLQLPSQSPCLQDHSVPHLGLSVPCPFHCRLQPQQLYPATDTVQMVFKGGEIPPPPTLCLMASLAHLATLEKSSSTACINHANEGERET